MIMLLSASALTLAALQASIAAPTKDFRGCLHDAVAKATSEKVAAATIEDYLRGACSAQMGSLKDALETRKLIERAKGVLMETHGLRESEAFHRIRKTSMDARKSMKEVAEAILLAHEMEFSIGSGSGLEDETNVTGRQPERGVEQFAVCADLC